MSLQNDSINVVSYYRVSTDKQARSGLGLAAQREYIEHAAEANNWKVVAEFTDAGVSGGLEPEQRDGLRAAIAYCNQHGATLVIAKLDRLSRDVEHIARMVKAFPFKVATMPHATPFELHIHAALAEQEKRFIRERTQAALKKLKDRAEAGDEAAKQKIANRDANRDKANANPDNWKPAAVVRQQKADSFADKIDEAIAYAQHRAGCKTLAAIADHMNSKGIKTRRGANWTPIAVSRVIERAEKKRTVVEQEG